MEMLSVARKLGASDLLLKPFCPGTLGPLLGELLNGK
jgi:hypothetical protein